MLLEEYVGFGPYKESGGWLGHYLRQQMHDIRLHLPFSKKDDEDYPDQPNGAPADRRMTPQQQEKAAREEAERDRKFIEEMR